MFPSPPGWEMRVIDNKYPIFDEKDIFTHEEYTVFVQRDDVFVERDAMGRDMLVIMSPYHIAPPSGMDYFNVLRLEQRITELELEKLHVEYVHIGRNSAGLPRKKKEKISGNEYYDMDDKMYSGASQEHPHERIISVPFVPRLILESYEKVENMARNNGHQHLFQRLLDSGGYTIEQGKRFALLADPTPKHTGGLVIAAYNAHNITELGECDLHELASMLMLGEQLLNIAYDGPPMTNYYRQSFRDCVTRFPDYVMNVRIVPRDPYKNGVHATVEEGMHLYVLTSDPQEVRDFMLDIKRGF